MQYEPLFVLRLYSHFFKLTRLTPRIHMLLQDFSRKYTSKVWIKERGRWVSKFDKVYAARSRDRTEYRFHINTLNDFKALLAKNYISEDLYQVEEVPLPEPVIHHIPTQKHRSLYDYQEPILNYVLAYKTPPDICRSKLVAIQTGKGKGSIALTSISKLGYRTLIIIKPMYIEKWFKEIPEVLDVKTKDMLVVQGGDQLRGLFAMAHNNTLKAKIIILSNKTYQNYLKAFETDPYGPDFMSYECHPDEMYNLLGVSLRLIDEVHQDFHLNFKADLYTHTELAISMSASLLHHNHFMETMYEVAYPKATRYDGLEFDKYLKVYPISYSFKDLRFIRTTEYGQSNYSHMAFEKSIMKHHSTMEAYVRMIKHWVDVAFVEKYQRGDKVLVFASSIAMCTELTRRFKGIYPQFKVKRYVEDDPFDNILTGEITVTTILSGGTAIDIPNLRSVVMTINVDSIQSNIQSSGRLRKLKDRDVKFYYLYCEQITKHKDYHQRRKLLLKDRVASIKELTYAHAI